MNTDSSLKSDPLGMMFAAWLVRLWLAIRAIQTGIEKYAGSAVTHSAVDIDGEPNNYGLTSTSSAKEYSFDHYQGVPQAMYEKLAAEPLIPETLLKLYDKVLGPALIVLGITILLGIASRTSLFLLGLLYISLTWGLVLLGQSGNAGVAWLAVHMILIAIALQLSRYNRFCILNKW